MNRSTSKTNTPQWTAALAAASSVFLAAQPAGAHHFHESPVGTVFVIAMENHNWTQPTNQTSPQQIFGNPAAPFINSLVTPGNSNATQVSFATSYHNAGYKVHPSEPNYVWAEAGTDFGIHTDAEPRPANSNIFNALHLTAQFNSAGISWNNYQEDVQLSLSPTNNASGTNGPVNPFYGTTQFNYAVKHNPMAFFPDTQTQNVYPLAQFFTDLSNHMVAQYNWITPNQYNDAHSALSGGFTYHGVYYTGDQSAIAVGDNFLAQVIPQIMATPEYKNNGVIIIWWDESEDGDGADRTIPEIVISPLAKGNAYASSVELNHSSDIKTLEEIFGLPFLNNPIPTAETNIDGGYNYVATVNDLSDLFKWGTIPNRNVSLFGGEFSFNKHNGHIYQTIHIRNDGFGPIPGPVSFVLDNLSTNVTLLNADGTTEVLDPGSPFVDVFVGEDNTLRPHEVKTVRLEFADPSHTPITYDPMVFDVVPTP